MTWVCGIQVYMEQVTSERDAAVAEVSSCQVSSSTSHHITPNDALKQLAHLQFLTFLILPRLLTNGRYWSPARMHVYSV